MSGPENLYRSGYNYSTGHGRFHVVISKPGPRGGKRPPLMDAMVYADSYDDAVEYVEQEFLRRTKTEVICG
jgi:hypothetical protein